MGTPGPSEIIYSRTSFKNTYIFIRADDITEFRANLEIASMISLKINRFVRDIDSATMDPC